MATSRTLQQQQQIEELCVQMEKTVSLLRNKTKTPPLAIAAAALTEIVEQVDDDQALPPAPGISEHMISRLRSHMSDLESALLLLPNNKLAGPDHASDSQSEDDDDEEYQGQISWEELLAAQRRRISQEYEEQLIRDTLPLIPYQQEYNYLEREEELESTRSAKEQIAMEEKIFAGYRQGTEQLLSLHASFDDTTRLSPMHCTHCTPGVHILYPRATTGTSLQIFTFKIDEIKCDLEWPLRVYGVVNARDNVDRNRNILFSRTRDHCQELTQDDPYLRLTGPSRGILAEGPLEFEVQLRVKGITESRDRALITQRYHYAGTLLRTLTFDNCLCTAQLSLEQVRNSVQATILGVRIVEGSGPYTFKYGGPVACSLPTHEVVILDSQGAVLDVTDPPSTQVVLLDSRHSDGGELPMGVDGYLDLSRRVVSVELHRNHVYYPEKSEGSLKVVVQAYSESSDIAAQGHVKFRPKLCNISQAVCDVGDSKVEITVAWSVLWSF
ncbi:uncharacterized protein LOC100833536 [Brachypodium distachyon]|uniref:DUF6598 domain-containing protein n=1 Tax=Brachypodium distachyon TaxID=15368 RepID=I1J3Q8_BRADI|nr:uncharacterized protein LOC100833536 [Brachypodium distachyon]PNT62214.1 hypothetical protein BRADI_5g27251v3 [Brachypodium distachyon]|eukprot:XP_010227347.1 uncharacterized protein LOC100833536 [Brachypodium distachyon]